MQPGPIMTDAAPEPCTLAMPRDGGLSDGALPGLSARDFCLANDLGYV